MSNTRYFSRGAEHDYETRMPRIKNKVEKRERQDESREINEAVRFESASGFLRATEDR